MARSTGNPSTDDGYPTRSIRLHWISALLIISMWPMGKFFMDDDATGFTGPGLYAIHIWMGLIVFVLTIVRVFIHFRGPKPPTLDMPRWEHVLFVLNHYGLYICLLLASLTGVGMLLSVGTLPLPGTSFNVKEFEDVAAADLHEGPATILMFLFVMHVAGVLYYQIKHGRTLKRMGLPV